MNYIKPCVPPVLSTFTQLNKGTRTITASVDVPNIYLRAASSAGAYNIMGIVKAPPSTPYSVTMRYNVYYSLLANSYIGCGWRNSSTGKLILSQYSTSANFSTAKFTFDRFSSYTVFDGNITTTATKYGRVAWQRLKDDGTTLSVELSADGVNFYPTFTTDHSYIGTPDQIGFFVTPYNAEIMCALDSYKVDY
jgi:hypothetical protein